MDSSAPTVKCNSKQPITDKSNEYSGREHSKNLIVDTSLIGSQLELNEIVVTKSKSSVPILLAEEIHQ